MASGTECESEEELIAASSGEASGRGGGSERRRRWKQLLWNGSHSVSIERADVPRDKCHVVYVCMLMAGAGFLFPWSSYITAIDYFFFLYWEDFHQVSVIIPMTYLVSTWLFTGLNISLVNVIGLHIRISLGYVLFLLSLVAIPLIDLLVHSCILSIHVAFYLTILSVAIVGIGSGVQQSSYYGLSGMLPQRYPQAVMAGESVATTVVSITRIITKVSTDNERFGAIAFFVVSIAFILVCVGCHQLIRTSPFVRYRVRQCRTKVRGGEGEKEEEEEEEGMRLESVDGESEEETVILSTQREQTSHWGKIRAGLHVRLRVMAEIWQLLVAGFFTYFITLLVFPGLVSLIQHCSIGDWTPILLVTVFNVPDLLAKWAALLPVRWSPSGLMTGSLLRTVLLLPILLLVTPSPSQPVIHSAPLVWAIVFVALLGFSNGYFGSLPMILFSQRVKDPCHLELAGTIMTLFLLTGLMVGSVLAFALTPLTTLKTYTHCSTNSTELFQLCSDNNSSYAV